MRKSDKFLAGEYETVSKAPCVVIAGGRRYKVRQVSNKVKERIALLEQEAQVLEAQGKEGVSQKSAKTLTKKLYC